jgi:hypothetical protein
MDRSRDERLALMVTHMLDIQEQYHNTRDMNVQRKMKRSEADVKSLCKEILHPKQMQKSLIEEAIEAGPKVGQVDPDQVELEWDGHIPPSDVSYP